MKERNKKIVEAVLLFVLVFLFQFILIGPTSDEIWNFGFSLNISRGMIPYVDFHMLQTPLFFFLEAFFLKIFGGHLFIFHLVNAGMAVGTYFVYKKLFGKNVIFPFLFILTYLAPTYSLLSLLLLGILLLWEKEKWSDFGIGVLLGLSILTKQHIGVLLLLANFFWISWKQIRFRFLGASSVGIFFLLYLFLSGSMSEFFSHTVLGIFEFVSNASVLSFMLWIFLGSLFFLLISLWKKREDRVYLKYILAFQIMAIPLLDVYHVLIALFPVLCYGLSKVSIRNVFYVGGICLLLLLNIEMTYLLSRANREVYSHSISFLWGRPLSKERAEEFQKVISYLKKHREENVFVIGYPAYLLRIASEQPLHKYDFLLEGNMGYKGGKKTVFEMDSLCKKEECTFLVFYPKKRDVQLSKEVFDYILDSYEETGRMKDFLILQNKKALEIEK